MRHLVCVEVMTVMITGVFLTDLLRRPGVQLSSSYSRNTVAIRRRYAYAHSHYSDTRAG